MQQLNREPRFNRLAGKPTSHLQCNTTAQSTYKCLWSSISTLHLLSFLNFIFFILHCNFRHVTAQLIFMIHFLFTFGNRMRSPRSNLACVYNNNKIDILSEQCFAYALPYALPHALIRSLICKNMQGMRLRLPRQWA